MPKKKRTRHQEAQNKNFQENEAVNKKAKRLLEIWGKECEKKSR